tara:strand:+ start:2515 stop:2775 length:261 start_codon:yes stop_codon:yes gene_type:complete
MEDWTRPERVQVQAEIKIDYLFDGGHYHDIIEMAEKPEDYPGFDFTEVLQAIIGMTHGSEELGDFIPTIEQLDQISNIFNSKKKEN